MSSINAAASGQFKIGEDLTVNRLGYGVHPRILQWRFTVQSDLISRLEID